MKNSLLKAFIAFLYIYCSDSIAQTNFADSTKVATPTSVLDEQAFTDVVVTGQYIPTTAKNATYKVDVITKEQLLTRGVTNLKEALDNQIGLDLSQDNVYGSSVSINGVSGEGVKILVNGVPIVGRIDGKIDLTQINLNNVERIEIIKGPQSVLYGTDALGGVINIITKTQKEDWSIFAKGLYESVGQYNVSGGAAIRKKGWSLSLDFGRNFFDGYSVIDTSRKKEWRPKEQYTAALKTGYQGKIFKVWTEFSFLRELMIDRGNIRPGTTQAFDTHFLTYRPGAMLGLSVTAPKNWQIDMTAGYSGFYRTINSYLKEMSTLEEKLRPSETQDTTVFHNVNIRPLALKSWPKKNIKLLTGLELNHIWSTQNRLIDRSKDMGDYAAFVSLQYADIKRLELQPAVRLLYNTQFKFTAIPSFNAKYAFEKYVVLRASYAMGYRAPSLKELYLNFKDSNHDINGNADLSPEKSQHVGASIDINLTKKKANFTIANNFNYNKISDKIDLVIQNPNVIPVAFQYFNLKNYLAITGDHEFSFKMKRIYASIGLYYQYTKVATSSISPEYSLWSADATAKAGYKIPKAEISLDIWYKYTGKRLIYVLNNSVQTGTRAGFHQLNISASRSFWKERINLTVGGKNLLNVQNVRSDNVSGVGHNFSANSSQVNWGRTFFCSLAFNFSKK